jgi:rod shape-determining protein MreC
MRKLIQFLVNHLFFILFLALEIVSAALIINFNNFQRSSYLNSANGVVGRLHNITSLTTEYFGLKEKNENLSEENALLLNRIFFLESQLERKERIQADTSSIVPEKNYHFLSAKVINNSTNKGKNYMTLNRGSNDGVKPGMGVISDQGIAGIVSTVSDHFSVVISVLNPIIKFSCKFKKNDYAGYIVWDGIDYRYVKLEDIPEHVSVAVGDTVITTGYTDGFPVNIPVGVVEEFEQTQGDPYYDIKVKLLTDFKVLSHVKIINYSYSEEQAALENSVW